MAWVHATWVHAWLCHYPTTWPWVNYFTCLGLSFLLHKIEIRRGPTLQDWWGLVTSSKTWLSTAPKFTSLLIYLLSLSPKFSFWERQSGPAWVNCAYLIHWATAMGAKLHSTNMTARAHPGRWELGAVLRDRCHGPSGHHRQKSAPATNCPPIHVQLCLWAPLDHSGPLHLTAPTWGPYLKHAAAYLPAMVPKVAPHSGTY